MCGINGILNFNSSDAEKPASFFEQNIRRMNDEIAHRGPDGDGMFIDYPVSLGFRRLSIIDLSNDAMQPMFNENRSLVIVFNGEIYNYLELIPDLKSKGHFFKTKSDTEVILHSFEEYGFDCVSRFNGMWAFVIYDIKNKLLFASRDRMGVKPFYYYKDDDEFIFSSEIKSILKVKDIRSANKGKVYDYLAYGYKTSNGDTFFENINELLPAHNLVINNDKMSVRNYWNVSDNEVTVIEPEKELRDLMYDSVRLRFRSDVPVSILLSGGLDSGLIAKITDELIDDHQLAANEVTAYTASFPGFMLDETNAVREFLKTTGHIRSCMITPSDTDMITNIDPFVYGMGEPVFSTTSFAHYMLLKEVKKQGVKVVLNGQGSDEAWCGYGRYITGYFLLDLLLSKPQQVISQMKAMSDKMKVTYKHMLQQTLKAIISRRYGSYLRSKRQEKMVDLFSNDFFLENYGYIKNPEYDKLSKGNLTGYLKYNLEYQGFTQILHYEDHSSMQNSIEMRSPFIDYRLIELAFSLPVHKKFNDGVTKKILREVFSEQLPQSIINNHNKIGFVTPFDNWMKKNSMKKFIHEILGSASFKSKNIFNAKEIENVISSDKYGNFPFWRLINFELWSRMYKINNL